tara:strand:+ start:841 stop:1893 length:1053 start_codon:yes stop_codon:yes gene_type:complete
MGYFNKGAINFTIVALLIVIISGSLVLLVYSQFSDVLMENADFNCLVGIRLANIAGATSSPCETKLAVIQPLEFKKIRDGNLAYDFKNCPQFKSYGESDTISLTALSQYCAAVKLADKGLTCWTNYMSGGGKLPTSNCFSLCLKPSYGAIALKDVDETITLPSQHLDFNEHVYIFPGEKFDSNNPTHLRQLSAYNEDSLGVELTPTEDPKVFEITQSQDYMLVLKIPFETISPSHLRETFEQQITTRRFSQSEKYNERVSLGKLRINTVPISGEESGTLSFIDTNFGQAVSVQVGSDDDVENDFSMKEGQSWIVQYIDSTDWIPFASSVPSYLKTDISEDSLNYGYNGVC